MDTTDRHFTRTWGRFAHKGKGKRAASKAKRRRGKRDVAERREG